MKIYFYTLGCRVNQYETDAARELFISRGHQITDDPSDADVCIVNTCTVTSEADRKSFKQLRKMARINPRAIICSMGCASEMANGVIDADIIVNRQNRTNIVDMVETFMASRDEDFKLEHCIEHIRPEVTRSDEYHEFGTVLSPEGTRAFVKIEDGCNKFCSYCIIPFARGRVSSRSHENIMLEVNNLASRGFKEVVLSGIHLCSYGKDRGEDISSLLKVLQEIDSMEGISRIRLGSLEPKSMTDEFIFGLKSLKKLCPHFHLSLQSGSDSVLKRMNRDYNTAEYEERVLLLRKCFPTMSLTTDIICGFPEETEEEFNETLRFVDTVKFNKIHVFPYSIREGTVAAKMKQVDPAIKKDRTNRLINWSNESEKKFAAGFVGINSSILVEKVETLDDGLSYVSGYTPEYVRAFVRADGVDLASLKGEIIEFLPESIKEDVIFGDMVKK